MADFDRDPFDVESLEALFEPIVGVPAALLPAPGCCWPTLGGGPTQDSWRARCC